MTRKSTESLRCGFTTGAMAAVAAVAAYRLLIEKAVPESVDLLFPDGQIRRFTVTPAENGAVQVIKDAGDDPDITDKAKIRAVFSRTEPAARRPEDYLLQVGSGVVILRGGEGVGLCRRRGLDCDEGRWAINKTPRRMVAENLGRAGFGRETECGLLEISVVDGCKLAQKTLNAKLGIENGISILGTSGIVYPYSHKAYIKTIAVLVRAVAESGGREVVLATGGRTLKAAEARLPELPEEFFIRIGDFIRAALAEAEKTRQRYPELSRVTIACMPGKLCKYAAGFSYTHAASVTQTLEPVVASGRELGFDEKLCSGLGACASVRQALEMVPENLRQTLLERLSEKALSVLRGWAPTLEINILLYDFAGRLLVERS